ncbi:10345_t:CDS:2 [Funneliformis mosseae]|uniref:10345_t:CDS:1 n=1 Tax=Funneliformis mosseae TaxID=27381 RepID=A0A9N9E567_FUNMO|nr:10345_t:CDS:2 [Funneliformis mosseae]
MAIILNAADLAGLMFLQHDHVFYDCINLEVLSVVNDRIFVGQKLIFAFKGAAFKGYIYFKSFLFIILRANDASELQRLNTDDQRAEASSNLSETSDWLYEEGEKAETDEFRVNASHESQVTR